MNQSGLPSTVKPIRTILLAGLATGMLDALAAMLMTIIRGGKDPLIVWKYVASGAFGKEALAGGTDMVIWGLAFHFLIALTFAALFFLIYPLLRRFIDNTVIMGLLYGIPVWVIMNLAVIPLSKIGATPSFDLSKVAIGMGILMVCIGLPNALIVGKQFGDR
ncbi:hypothetical protein GCM10028805_55230 [Spirosoma harenae]